MSECLKPRYVGRVAVLEMGATAGVAFDQSQRFEIASALEKSVTDDKVVGVVVLADHGLSAEGYPNDNDAAPMLSDLCDQIEDYPKPIVMCFDGTVMGAGLEVAVAAHARLATKGAEFGFAEITFGLLPTSGGTVRTPRLVGAEAALELLLSGQPIKAGHAANIGLIDRQIDTDLEPAGVALCEEMAERLRNGKPLHKPSTGFEDPGRYMQAIRARRQWAQTQTLPAITRIIDCVEAAFLLPLAEALAYERAAFEDCLETPESRALCHAAMSEKYAWQVPEPKDATSQQLGRIGVVGGDQLGAEIAVGCLAAGFHVVVSERNTQHGTEALDRIEALMLEALDEGRLSEEKIRGQLARLTVVIEARGLRDCDLVVGTLLDETGSDYTKLEAALGPDPVLVTAITPSANLFQIEGWAHPERLIGVRFQRPAHRAELFELINVEKAAPDVLAKVHQFVQRLNGVPVQTTAKEPSIGARVLAAYHTAMHRLIEMGTHPEQIDDAMQDLGFQSQRYSMTEGEDVRLPPMRLHAGVVTRPMSPEDICRHALAAMANEGARLVGEGVAFRPSDVDVVMIRGYGFPRVLGGPMHWADEAGPLLVRDDLRRWDAQSPGFWEPAPLWAELVKHGGRFAAMV